MKPYHLQIQLTRESSRLNAQWFGTSALYEAGSAQCMVRLDADMALVPDQLLIDPLLIDLQPLLAEIATDTISSQEEFQAADGFLLLRDLLADDEFEKLCETLYHFLWSEAQRGAESAVVQKGDEGKIWVDPDGRLVRVWFATNRKPVESDDLVVRFDSEQSADDLTYGVCNVFIPKSHKPGSIGTPWWRRWIRLEASDSLKVHGMHALPREVFWAGLARKLENWWDADQRNLFVLIHGFNVSFEEAAVRAAQIGYDLKVPGEMAFYSWPRPSHGAATAYAADEATIGASVPHIAQFLHELSEHSGANRIHLFVHSMGNRGFLRALERLAADRRPSLRLGQVFFCAPDEDVRTFKDTVNRYPHESEQRTLLVSPDDQAVFLSQWKHRHDRVGYVPPITIVEGIETIEVGGFGLLEMGHGYFAESGPIIDDIREAIETGRPARERRIPRAFGDHFAIDIRQH
ncbi:MAG: alpha/beta hydrolase [Pirellula sp.]|nr:alpha/beta hydrolase [Pirellula sp.]